MSEHYDFHYQPTGSGAISGQQVLQQTEDAINELGDYVNDNVGGAMDVAQQALETAQNAETNAQTALDTANSFSSAIQSAQQDASTALSTAQTAQTTASNANNTAIQAQQDASSAVTTANNASGQVSTLSGTVTTLGQRVTTAEGNIGQNTSDITALTTRVGTAEGNITTLQNDVSIAQGNASSAMATAGQVKQQAYVFRYSSTALVASSTNSNTLLDNTDNLKVGDKVIDSDGVLFSITAIDTANSTFTVGSALVDLAKDSDVVHTSGDETVGGNKTFTGVITNNISNKANAYITLKNSLYDPKTNGQSNATSCSFSIAFNTLTDDSFAYISAYGLPDCSMLRLTTTYFTDSQNSITDSIEYRIYPNGNRSLRPRNNNNCLLGETSRRWKDCQTNLINGLTPSSLGMPDIANKIDISSYITDLAGVNNEYTPTVNGWICVRSGDATKISILDSATSIGVTSISPTATYLTILVPCIANRKVYINIMCTSLSHAYFIPCQGNV